MISQEKYNTILSKGLLLDHYLLLVSLNNNVKLPQNRRIQGFYNLLVKKDYIKDEVLTQKGLDIVDNSDIMLVEPTQIVDTKIDRWAFDIHSKCENLLIDITGSKQHKAIINGKPYPFLPNSTDLTRKLISVIKHYKLKDLPKIELTLLNYIRKCNNSNNWFPLMQYFIMKDGASAMVTMMEEDNEEEQKESSSTQKFV